MKPGDLVYVFGDKQQIAWTSTHPDELGWTGSFVPGSCYLLVASSDHRGDQ